MRCEGKDAKPMQVLLADPSHSGVTKLSYNDDAKPLMTEIFLNILSSTKLTCKAHQRELPTCGHEASTWWVKVVVARLSLCRVFHANVDAIKVRLEPQVGSLLLANESPLPKRC
eukprot:5590864-Amphidinium_carterae.1